MRFEPFYVYELDAKQPLAKALPFTFFLCMTLPQKAAFSVRHNIVGFPLLKGRPRYGADPLRMPLRGNNDGKSQLEVIGDVHVAIDLLQPMNYDLFLPQHRGQILQSEIVELQDKLRAFLAV